MPALQSGPEPSMVDNFYVQDVARRALHWAGLVGDVSRDVVLRWPASCNLPPLIFLLIGYGLLEVLHLQVCSRSPQSTPIGMRVQQLSQQVNLLFLPVCLFLLLFR